MKQNLFSQKIDYLFKALNITEDEFVKLFWNGIKPSFATRKKSVINKWYEGDIAQAKAFYFDTYPISRLNKGGQPFFTKGSFLNDSIEEFKKRVDIYIAHITQPKNTFEYKYIYYYDINLKVVTYVKLYTVEEIERDRYKIRMITSELYKDREIDTYYGDLNIINDYYHISVKNNFEIVTFYFMLNKGFRNNSAIYGLRLGLSYDKGLPISGKNLLSKKILSKEEEEQFYLNANETDTLISEESSIDIYSSEKRNYLKKLHHKIANITTFMKKSRKILSQSVDRDVYISLFHDGLSSLNQISQKVYNNRTFYSSRRRSARKVFLRKLSLTPNSSCAFVYPLFAKDSTLFATEDKRSREALEDIVTVAKSGLKIDMVIVMRLEDEMTEYIKESTSRLIEHGIDIRIVLKESIESSITSYDFIYSKSKKVAIYRNAGDRICYFKVTNNIDSINNLSYDFEKIKRDSYSFDDFIAQKHIKMGKKLKHLIGRWYAYSYGTIEEAGQTKIWEVEYEIDRRENIEGFYNDELKYKGYLKLNNINKSYIVLTSIRSRNRSFIIFHNKDIYKKIFKVNMLYNQFSTERDIVTFGIVSRIKLDLDVVRETLGESGEITLKESIEFEDRVKSLYLKHEF
ncbi:hypothetical protein MNB_SV-12-974 [hydrothermal vent metagenome]|uniref:Uncharacterized protein n=1 Tax=hydrothermal vent metagenome TaxID=652676 RepID=A0A1W1BLK1_9ZZZZ